MKRRKGNREQRRETERANDTRKFLDLKKKELSRQFLGVPWSSRVHGSNLHPCDAKTVEIKVNFLLEKILIILRNLPSSNGKLRK